MIIFSLKIVRMEEEEGKGERHRHILGREDVSRKDRNERVGKQSRERNKNLLECTLNF